jgi:hypothetical protein
MSMIMQKLVSSCAIIYLLIFVGPLAVQAGISGGVACSQCHTMHYSQGGGLLPNWRKPGSYGSLLINDCIGCHTGTNGVDNVPRGVLATPYVLDEGSVYYGSTGTEGGANTLAGGNFYWVATVGDRTGHNVVGIAGVDSLVAPPGYIGSGFEDPDGNAAGGRIWSGQVTCAGTNGCHGKHDTTDQMAAIAKSHHGGDSTIDGLTVATSYRFLYGIVGLEDSDWEYRPTASAHNQYKGVDRVADMTSGATNTISYLCAECHGMFHSGVLPEGVDNDTTFASPWFRHPVDFAMYNVRTKTDYQGYGGVGVNNYEVIAPVASSDVNSVISTGVYSSSGKAIVTCISCHRAHGTPNDAILRWNYKAWPGGGYAGCQVCHTIKD